MVPRKFCTWEDNGAMPQKKLSHLNTLWKEFFKDPSQWWDNRSNKTNPKFPDFKHKITKQTLWIHGCYNPSWVHKELVKRHLHHAFTLNSTSKLPSSPSSWISVSTSAPTEHDHIKLGHVFQQTSEQDDLLSFSESLANEDASAIVAMLKSCTKTKDLSKGRMIHKDIVNRRLLEKDVYIGSSLVNMYAKCGELAIAQDVFEQLPIHNEVSWTVLITGYTQNGHGNQALNCLRRMQQQCLSPNTITFVCALKACGSIGATAKGREIHAQIMQDSLLEKNLLVGNALVDMYSKCGALIEAQETFNKLPFQDTVSWNVLIAGYLQNNHGVEALGCFQKMRQSGLPPDEITFLYLLKACGCIGSSERGNEIHSEIVKEGLLQKNQVLGNAVVDMYAKCGALGKAKEVFDELPVRDVVSWTSLISGYAQHGQGEEALKCFDDMQTAGLSPNAITFVCVLKACGSIGASDKGEEIYNVVLKEKLLKNNVLVGNALVDMYAKCGELTKAHEVFEEIPVRTVSSWNALITGYAQIGEDNIVCDLFEKMTQDGVVPNQVTFIVVLNACSHSGLLDKGRAYFETMTVDHGIVPTLEHYACMIDLFSRAGHFDDAIKMVNKMPTFDYLPVWTALLGASRKWRNVEVGRWAFQQVVRLEAKDPAAYVCMSNIYADADMQEESDRIEAMQMTFELQNN